MGVYEAQAGCPLGCLVYEPVIPARAGARLCFETGSETKEETI